MCGIIGVFNQNGKAVSPQTLERMTTVLQHRGPDDQGMRLFSIASSISKEYGQDCAFEPGLDTYEGGLGFQRLSILDLSKNGHQPMTAADDRIILTFNGEIYNAFELRPQLQELGYQFHTQTDTEVILRLYEHYGWEAMLERINGMFAICIADLRTGSMFLARDRLGIKPLYWYHKNDVFMFSSEVKSFLQHPEFRPEIDNAKIDEQLIFRFNAGTGSPIKGVRQLEPGHWMRISRDSMSHQQFWSIPDREPGTPMSFSGAVSELESQLSISIRRQLLSDVKVGCQLSGGIDSSLVTVLAAAENKSNLDAISIVFDDQRVSEEQWIKEAVSCARVDSHIYKLDADYFASNIADATWSMDQPLNHPNALGIHCLARRAKNHVTVLLSGDGADELLGGYPRFAHALFRPRIKSALPVLRYIPGIGKRIWRRFGFSEHLDAIDWFVSSSAFMTPDLLQQLKPDADIATVLEQRREIFKEGQGDYLSNCMRYELRTYLVDLLIRQDKMSMAHSIENRVPFLDHELVEFARQMPSNYNVRPSIGLRSSNAKGTKRTLKKVASKHFDHSFVYRPKSGFSLPLLDFFGHSQFVQRVEDQIIPGIKARGILNSNVVTHWWRNRQCASAGVIEALWICVAFELWAQVFVDRIESPAEILPR